MPIKALIIDLDGTVYLEGRPICNVVELLNQQHENDIYLQFLTNNTSVSKKRYVSKLKQLSLNFVTEDHILTPIDAFLNFAVEEALQSCFYLLPREVIKYIEKHGGPPMNAQNPELVVVGFDRELNYQKLRKASEFINEGLPYVLTHIDLACPTERGPIPDCGSIANLLQSTTGKDWAVHFGKPSEKMGDMIQKKLSRHSIKKSETVLIGDRYYTDMALGNKIGIQTCHVQTGETNKLNDSDPNIYHPTHEYDDICLFIKDFL